MENMHDTNFLRAILLLIGLCRPIESALPLTDNIHWPGGFQGSFTVPAKQRVGGWTAHLTFDASVNDIQVWKGTVTSMSNGGRAYTIQSKSSDRLLLPGQDLIVEIQGYTKSRSGSPRGTFYIEDKTTPLHFKQRQHSTMKYDYREALRLSILFYNSQRSGKLPLNNPVPWRGDSNMNDRDKGHDLTGGWYDAGDHIKFGFPLAGTVTLLELGLLRFYDGYDSAGQVEAMCDMIKWPLVYMLKTWVPETQTLYVQVGDAKYDHNSWARPEVTNLKRPAYFVNASCPGSDVAAGTAAAMAAGAIVFKTSCHDRTFSNKLRKAAVELYRFAKEHRGFYDSCLKKMTKILYTSYDDHDDLATAAAWLYKLTGEVPYLNDAESFNVKGVPWASSYDDQTAATNLLLYEITRDSKYRSEFINFIFGWMPGGRVTQTPCGLAWRTGWGCLRFAANAAFLALLAADRGIYPEELKRWALGQINYMLGDNNYNMSYQIGFGQKYPLKSSHRGSSCSNVSPTCDVNDPGPNYNMLSGGLVGGPSNKDEWVDDRQDYQRNEVAIDYNAGFQGALAGLVYFAQKGELPESPAPLC